MIGVWKCINCKNLIYIKHLPENVSGEYQVCRVCGEKLVFMYEKMNREEKVWFEQNKEKK